MFNLRMCGELLIFGAKALFSINELAGLKQRWLYHCFFSFDDKNK